jgi:hypothetical protein
MNRQNLVVTAGLILCSAAFAANLADTYFSNVRQLTSGGQNAEAYWSPDGSAIRSSS